MSDQEPRIGKEELQFDRVITESASFGAPSKLAVTCAACHTSIETEYYHFNGNVLCSRCRTALESAVDTPRGFTPLITAGVFGLGAGVFGAVIYYAVMAIAHLEIGIVAILIGYMVGYAVRKGARGRGGLRFQVVAVALTYVSVALAYTPIAIKQAIAALPVLIVLGSFPSGLISALIIFIGMRQAWRMTGAPALEILGPYRVGTAPASTPA
jgi:hypothetical protein